jgi:ABC-type nitrate/sulfonate/bicarbonate transport system permease component
VKKVWSAAGRFASIAALLVVWELAVVSHLVDDAFLPPVHKVVGALWDLALEGGIWTDLSLSVFRALTGLFFGAIVGVGLGLLMATSKHADGFFGPLVAATYSLPKAALVPLFVLWFGVGNFTDILTVFLASLLPVVVNTYHGVKAVPRTVLWSARAFGTPPRRILLHVLMPASSPQILTGVRIALGFSWVLTISSEMIAAKSGIGKVIFLYGENGAYEHMFAGIFAIVVVAWALDTLLVRITARLLRWHDSAGIRRGAP